MHLIFSGLETRFKFNTSRSREEEQNAKEHSSHNPRCLCPNRLYVAPFPFSYSPDSTPHIPRIPHRGRLASYDDAPKREE